MKRLFLTFLLTILTVAVFAQTFTEWLDPAVNEINRLPMRASYFAYESAEAARKGDPRVSERFLDLDGTWKFSWVRNADQRPTDFFRPGFNDGAWGEMPVPGLWELNGYGDPQYLNVGYAWREQFENNPPYVPIKENHVGSYRREIEIPASWSDSHRPVRVRHLEHLPVGQRTVRRLQRGFEARMRVRHHALREARQESLRLPGLPLVRRHLSRRSGLLPPLGRGPRLLPLCPRQTPYRRRAARRDPLGELHPRPALRGAGSPRSGQRLHGGGDPHGPRRQGRSF